MNLANSLSIATQVAPMYHALHKSTPPPQFTAKRPVRARCLAALLIFALGAFAVPASHAQTAQTVRSDSGLVPDINIGIGDSFRLLFVTSDTSNANSSDIADYNTFVQEQAAAATGRGTPIATFSSEFRALISTAAVDARDNTATNHVKTSPDPDAPIYWLNGAQVASNYADFYDSRWGSTTGRNQNGVALTPSNVWTGSNNNGTKEAGNGAGSNSVRAGDYSNPGFVIRATVFARTQPFPLYALSPILTVKDALSFKVKVFLEGAQ